MNRIFSLLSIGLFALLSCNKPELQSEIPVTGIVLDQTELILTIGEQKTLIATVSPENATNKDVSWSTSNKKIATVVDGLVSAISAGEAIITATTDEGGKKATCVIAVKKNITAITGNVDHISCRNAKIFGKVNLPQTTSEDLTFGILYSTSSNVLIETASNIEAKSFDSDYNFTIDTEVLEPGTTYYYRSYVLQSGEITYGEIKSFKTLAVSSMIQTLDATNVNPKDAVLNAKLDLTDCKYEGLEYGFKITSNNGQTHSVKADNNYEKRFSSKDENLSRDTKYSVSAYVILDGRLYKGEAKDFTTTSVLASITADTLDVKCKTATISGTLTVESEGTFTTSAKLYYSRTASTLDEIKANGTSRTLRLSSDGSVSVDMSWLVHNTQYNYVVVTSVDEIIFNSEVKSFKTLQIVASVTAESSNVKCTIATISGALTVESEGTFTTSAKLYYSRTASTLDEIKANGTNKTLALDTDGAYSVVADGLSIYTKHYYCVVAMVDGVEFASPIGSLTTLNYQTPALVDLGLSVKWATCNIDASCPEDYGGYYQWAGTQDVSDTSIYLELSNCPYHTGSEYEAGWTKYVPRDQPWYWSGSFEPDEKTVLDPKDDVAHVILGGKWRMPTPNEWTELRSECTWTWTTLNGVNGYRVTSKKTGYTNNSIFLPAAGIRYGGRLHSAGSEGYYWSSSLFTGSPGSAHILNFLYSGIVDTKNYQYRHYGLSVRPVCK